MQRHPDSQCIKRPIQLKRTHDFIVGSFDAMASPCEILIDTRNESLARHLTEIAASEAWRIEQKFSRYRKDGIVPKINTSRGQAVRVDAETAGLIDFAYRCYELSDGMFDVTSGVLRKAWNFDGGSNIPSQTTIDKLLLKIGLSKVSWNPPFITLPSGMEIDFGGVGKEYAVDKTLGLLVSEADVPVLVNFGGDVCANTARTGGRKWKIGIEKIDEEKNATELIRFTQGGIATSGDSKRFLIKNGKRYSHILNPKTGWPVENAPRSITVFSASCTEAGILSSLAMMQGMEAQRFLENQGVQYSCQM